MYSYNPVKIRLYVGKTCALQSGYPEMLKESSFIKIFKTSSQNNYTTLFGME
jgi:hypothetical protein